jgi:hypothetical protein
MDRYFAGFLIVYLTIDRYKAPWISGRLWYQLWYGSGGSCPCFLGLVRRRMRREMTCRGSVLVPHQGSSRERSPERCSTSSNPATLRRRLRLRMRTTVSPIWLLRALIP